MTLNDCGAECKQRNYVIRGAIVFQYRISNAERQRPNAERRRPAFGVPAGVYYAI